MHWAEVALLAIAGFTGGLVNSMAGGGSFFSFASLVAVGLPSLDANATSAAAMSPSNVAIVAGSLREVREHPRDMLVFSLIGLVGGAIGALFLVWLGDARFRPMVPWLLLSATVLFALSGQLRRLTEPLIGAKGPLVRFAGYVVMLLVSIYGGFFGAGMGIMMLAALAVLEDGDYFKANALKNVAACVIQIFSAAILIATGLVHWPEGIVTMISSTIGGFLGIRVARRVPQQFIRFGVILAGAGLTVIFFQR